MNVLVYAGPEVLQISLNHTLSTLRTLLSPNYSVQSVTSQSLSSHPWSAGCAVLVFPSCSGLSASPNIATVKSYIEAGGSFLALGAGAIYSSRASGIPASSVPKEHNLRLFDKSSGSYLYPSFHSSSIEKMQSSVQLSSGVVDLASSGVPKFAGTEDEQNVQILARNEDGSAAAMRFPMSKGRVVLWTCNPEFPAIGENEALRLAAFRETLTELGLDVPSAPGPEVLRPQPQYLTASQPQHIERVLKELASSESADDLKIFKDESDTFHFRSLEESDSILADASKGSTDPSTWNPKHIIVCSNDSFPTTERTPLFNLQDYYTELRKSRESIGCVASPTSWGCGEVAFYSEVVTSTQTMFEKNPRFLSALPTPTLSIASHQLAGRGRGSNVWLSPAGCLQFSLHIRVSTVQLPPSKLVFVQYLFGLAVVEACRSEGVMGPQWGETARLKWPNDLYAVVGSKESDVKKIGGVLINTSFMGGQVDIIIGCGLNVLNPPPITSLSQLLPAHAPPLSMERTTAAIMVQWDRMWGTFLAHKGSFEPFMGLYLERWLHSDQLVTLTTTTPPKQVRITGITPDHGLLRTMPERTGWSRGDEGFIDLQPDGNSFDLMAGMIRTKT